MSETTIPKKEALQKWEKFRDRVLPPAEMQKGWAQTPAKWSDLPEKERRHLPELNAFVQRILDSNEECIPEIYDEYPVELKLLLIFQLRRIDAFLDGYFQQYPALRVPSSDSLQSFFRDLMFRL